MKLSQGKIVVSITSVLKQVSKLSTDCGMDNFVPVSKSGLEWRGRLHLPFKKKIG